MKRLGLLGGMSWESSIEYERTINQLVRERLGGVASADLLIRSFNFADIEALQSAGRWDDAADESGCISQSRPIVRTQLEMIASTRPSCRSGAAEASE